MARPLYALASLVLIAYTIELDNAFESEMPHRSRLTGRTSPGAPYLVSVAWWLLYLRFVDAGGTSFATFMQRTGLRRADALRIVTRGASWWGYLAVDGDVVRRTAAGSLAHTIWESLFPTIDERWEARFGAAAIAALRRALHAIVDRFEPGLPAYAPVLGYGLALGLPQPSNDEAAERATADRLPTLLSRLVVSFACEVERESRLSFALAANVVRVIDERETRVRDVLARSGISKELLQFALGYLAKQGLIAVGRDGAARTVRLTREGVRVREHDDGCIAAAVERWRARYGADAFDVLAGAVRTIVDARDGERRCVAAGLMPPDDGWRAQRPYRARTDAFVRDPIATLPWYPAVWHRGGWPDGS